MGETDTPAEAGYGEGGFGMLNLSPESATTIYGIYATVIGIFVPLWFNIMMRGHSIWGKIGWKFSAYSHLYTWCPVAFVWLITLGLKSSTALYFWSGITRFSVFGPFVFYPIATFYLFKFGWKDGESKNMGVLHAVYTMCSMIFQVALLPAVDAGYW